MQHMASVIMDDASEFETIMKDTVLKEEKRAVPENVFREIFLPFFKGEVKASNEADYVAHWAGLVGPSSPATVVDIQGKPLFDVPPLFDTASLNTERTGQRYENTLFQYVDQARVHPAIAQAEYVENMAPKLEALLPKEPTNAEGWRKIYEYYDLTGEKTKTASEQKPDAEDFFE
jgi:hypothetical protein